jgi:hypothetical protein
MGVVVSLPLFGNPGRELEEGAPVSGRQLRELARGLTERLEQAAGVLDRLAADGWSVRVALFDVLLSHPQVGTPEEAVRRLRAADVDPEALVIVADVEDEEAGG